MKNIEAVEKLKTHYKSINGSSIRVEKVTESTIKNLVGTCNARTHIEERFEWYDDERDTTQVNWVDVEGEGYGWLWVDKTEELCRALLKERLLKYAKAKQAKISDSESYVLIINRENTTIYHFVEREERQLDVIYTLSDDEIFY